MFEKYVSALWIEIIIALLGVYPLVLSQELYAVDNVKIVFVGFREGHRNPERLLPSDPNKGKWGQEGPLMLTNIGKRQSLSVGKFLRKRYGKLLSDQWDAREIKVFSSSGDSQQQTVQATMAGLYPPVVPSVWNPDIKWQPIPYSVNDTMLRISSAYCPVAQNIKQMMKTVTLPHLQASLQNDKVQNSYGVSEMLVCIVKCDGFKAVIDFVNQTNGGNVSFGNLMDIADNLESMLALGLQLPDWAARPRVDGLTAESFYDKLKKIAAAAKSACATYEPCRNIHGGIWLNDMLNTLKSKVEKRNPELKAVVYSADADSVLSIMQLLQFDKEVVPPSAGWILEYRDAPYPSVRLLYHEPADVGQPDERRLERGFPKPACAIEQDVISDWCPISAFLERVANRTIANWETACKVEKCQKETDSGIETIIAEARDIQLPNRKPMNASIVDNKPTTMHKTLNNADSSCDNCAIETDKSDTSSCLAWAKAKYCELYPPVRWLFCRKTCLCTLKSNAVAET